jgi:hypothetical protein
VALFVALLNQKNFNFSEKYFAETVLNIKKKADKINNYLKLSAFLNGGGEGR